MSIAPLSQSGAKRRIGDILLELGFASEEALAIAATEQELTGQPLGQILVEHGVITRLELASALAEQWSDLSNGASALPAQKPTSLATPHPQDEDQYAARLQEAVAELAQRVGMEEPNTELDERITDLAERLEATVARTQRIEATLAAVSQGLESVTTGVEEAFGTLQTGIADLALDLARVETAMAESAAGPAEPPAPDPVLAQQLEELRSSLGELSERPVTDELARGRVDELASRLESAADAAGLAELRDELVELGLKVETLAVEGAASSELEEHAQALEGVRSALADLEDRVVTGGGLDTRLEQVEAHLDERLASLAAVSAVEELAAQLEQTAGTQESVAAAIDELGLRLDGLTALGDGNGAADPRLEGLEARLDDLAAALAEARWPGGEGADPSLARRLEDVSASVDVVRADLASLAESAASPRLDELADRIERLALELDANASLVTGLVTSDGLSQALAEARQELAASIPEPDTRVDQLVEELADLRARLDGLDLAPEPDPPTTRQLEALAASLAGVENRLATEVVTSDGLSQALADSRRELTASIPEPDPRVDQLVEELTTLRAQFEGLNVAPEPDPTTTRELEALRAQVEVLTADLAAHSSLAAKLESVENRLVTELVTSDDLSQALAQARAELAAASPGHDDRIDRLHEELSAVRDQLAAASLPPNASGSPSPEQIRREIELGLEDLTHRLEERLANADGSPQGSDTATFDAETERSLMAIERLGLRLGEHDRALAELMGSRGVTRRLDELAARIEDLSASGPGGSESVGSGRNSGETSADLRALARRLDDAEESSRADREKLLTRIEKMVARVDWRLQRLETGAD